MDVIVYTIPNLARLTVASNQDVAAKVADYDKRFHGAEHLVRYTCSDAGRIAIGYESEDATEWRTIHVESDIVAEASIVKLPVIFEQLTYFFDIDFDEGLQGLDESSIRVKHYLTEFTDSFNRRGRSIRGQFSFVNEPGRFRIEIVFKVDSVERSIWLEFTVASTKMDVMNDYREILRAVESWDRSLIFSSKAKTLHEVKKLDEKATPDDLKNWVVYFDKVLDVYERALRRILHEPNRRMVSSTYYHRVDQIKKWTPTMVREYARFMGDAEKLERHRFVDTIREMTFDTKENRFVKYTLQKLTAYLQIAQKEFSGDKDYSDVFKDGLKKRIDRFRRYQRDSKFASVENGHAMTVNSLVMQMRPGYSDIRVVWTLMNSLFSSDISLSARRNPSVGFAKLSALYEFWCFITVKELMDGIMRDKFGISPTPLSTVDAKRAVEAATVEENVPGDAPIAYSYGNGSGVIAQVAFQQSYGPASKNDVFAAPFQQRPDIVVRLQDKAHVYTYLFDAKYRIENSSWTGRKDAAPRDALDQMHRYRDAILWRKNDGAANSSESVNREVVGAYILYPADTAKTDIVPVYIYDSLIREQNIGAFALLPNRVDGLRIFLSSLVDKLDINAETSGWLLKEKQVIPQKGLYYTDDKTGAVTDAMTLDVNVEDRQYAAFAKDSYLRFPVRADHIKSAGKVDSAIRRIRVHMAGEATRILDVEFSGVRPGKSYVDNGGQFSDARSYPWASSYFVGLMVEYSILNH